MAAGPFAWVTHAPADYMLVFIEDPDGEHAIVGARFEDREQAVKASRGLKGLEVEDEWMRVYCTLPGEPERALAQLQRLSASASVERGRIAFVAVGDGSGTSSEVAGRRREARARIVRSGGGDIPRCYSFERQCATCGELRGKIHVLPGGGVYIDTRELSCRCVSISCRYCREGRVRRPLSEHFDPERRAGRMPWFGYLVPCGGCQASGRGPRVQMST
jgi:hypothetical protein